MASSSPLDWLRRLLRLWVRLRIYPDDLTSLGLDPDRPVCYVLRENWLSDRLVLREAVLRAGLPGCDIPLRVAGCCLASADFALLPGWRLRRRARARRMTPLACLTEAIARAGVVDVQLVPVTVLWGRAPKQQDGILRALLAESWQRRQPLGHWFAVLVHGRQTHVHFGRPLSLRALLGDVPAAPRAAKKAARLLRVHFHRQRELLIGPDVSHRHTQVEALLAGADVHAAIAAEVHRRKLPLTRVRELARRHALAIAADYSYGVMRALEIFLTWLWTRLFDGVEVRHIERLTQLSSGQTIVYLPCHRSHVDYLLMSYVIYRAGLTPPHIAAGDNLDLPLLGRLLRGGGAFFLRRSFKNDPLYAAVFAAYLHRILAQGFSVEYFIEGGRSRSGLMLPPRTGLLRMTLQGFLRRPERPLVFMPVYLGYEKLPEGASFIDELSGRPKQRESWLGLLAALRILRRHFGRVYVNFGVPLPLAEWLAAHEPDMQTEASANTDDRFGAVAGALAQELSGRIAAAALANPVNLVALALLATPRATADAGELACQIEHLLALLEADQQAAPATGAACIGAALRLGVVHRIEHPLGALIAATAHEAAQLAYFRNNVLHLVALPALVACLIVQHGPLTHARLREMVADLLGLLCASLPLRLSEDELPQVLAGLLERLAGRDLITLDDERIVAAAANTPPHGALAWLAEMLRPQMERYFLVLMLLRHAGSGRLTRVALVDRGVQLAQRLTLVEPGRTPEFADRLPVVALVAHLLDNGILRENAARQLEFGPMLARAAAQAEALLSPVARLSLQRQAVSAASPG